MTFKLRPTPEAEADLSRMYDFLLDRAVTVEEAMRAFEAVERIASVPTATSRVPPIATTRQAHARPCANSSFRSPLLGTFFASTAAHRNWALVIGAPHQREQVHH